jgi:hypothetical protein
VRAVRRAAQELRADDPAARGREHERTGGLPSRLSPASGLVIGFTLAPRLALAQDRPAQLPGSLNGNRMLDAWLRIDPNGTVTIFTGKIELGQGIGTALSQIAATSSTCT